MGINKKILVIGNGGIAKDNNGCHFANQDVGEFLDNLISSGTKIKYISNHGNIKLNRFLFTYNLDKNNIKYRTINGSKRNPLFYRDLLVLIYYCILFPQIYIFYPGGISGLTSRICIFLNKSYGIYVRGYGLYRTLKDNSTSIDEFNDPFILRKAAYLITVSPKMQKDLKKLNQNTHIIKPMLKWNLEEFDYRDINSYKKKTWIFLFVGTIDERKGIFEIVEIVKRLEKKELDFIFNIVGDGPLLEYFIKEQSQNRISRKLKFLGSISDQTVLKKMYSESDIFILLSRNEGFPRVLYEAMIKGLPIMTVFVSGIAGTMVSGYNCIELPYGNPEAQVNKIIESINDQDLLNKISINGITTVKHVLSNRLAHHEVIIKIVEHNSFES